MYQIKMQIYSRQIVIKVIRQDFNNSNNPNHTFIKNITKGPQSHLMVKAHIWWINIKITRCIRITIINRITINKISLIGSNSNMLIISLMCIHINSNNSNNNNNIKAILDLIYKLSHLLHRQTYQHQAIVVPGMLNNNK